MFGLSTKKKSKKKFKKHKGGNYIYTGRKDAFSRTVSLAWIVVLVSALSILYLFLKKGGESVRSEIVKEEKQKRELINQSKIVESDWDKMKTQTKIRAALSKHGVFMSPAPTHTQRIAMNATTSRDNGASSGYGGVYVSK